MEPGLVGGHCIGVDPYYLTHSSKEVGYYPDMILTGRKINNGMAKYVGQQMVKFLIDADINISKATVMVLGFSFKKNVSDTRNTKVIDLLKELEEYKINTMVVDPIVNKKDVKENYDVDIVDFNDIKRVDGIIIAVAHDEFCNIKIDQILEKLLTTEKLFMI